jgi:hypothetical protein
VYHYGKNVVPFEPREDLIAVCFETRSPDPKRARAEVQRIVGLSTERTALARRWVSSTDLPRPPRHHPTR